MTHRDEPFYYPEASWAVVTGAADPNATRTLRADLAMLDGRCLGKSAIVAVPFGFFRLPQQRQSALVEFADGHNQFPIILGHTFNTETSPLYADHMPIGFAMIDDVIMYQDETGAFARFRNLWSATSGGPNGTNISGGYGAPGEYRVHLASGVELLVTDYPNGSRPTAPAGSPVPPPPAPVRGKVSITMPDGTSLVIDQPAAGQSTLAITMHSGTQIAVDVNGNLSISVPNGTKTTINSTGSDGDQVARKADVEAIRTAYNSHTHLGVQSGSGTSGAPSSTISAPAYAQKTYAD